MPKKQIGKKIDVNGNQLDLGYTVTQDEINSWNNKSDFSGSYNDLTNKPTIPTNYVTTNTDQNINADKTFVNSAIKFMNSINKSSRVIVPDTPSTVWSMYGDDMGFSIQRADVLGNIPDTFFDINAGLGKMSLNSHELIMDNDNIYQFAKEEYNKSFNLLNISSLHWYPSGFNVIISDKIYISGSSSIDGGIEFDPIINLKPNTTYTLKILNQTGTINHSAYFWDYVNNVSYGGVDLNALNGYSTFTTPNNVSDIVRLNVFYNASMGNIDISFNVMLVHGSIIPTEYVPYYGSIVHQKEIHPVGSIYMSVNSTSPASLFGGSWEQLPANYALWTATSGAGETINAGLPNIVGQTIPAIAYNTNLIATQYNGAFKNINEGNINSGYFQGQYVTSTPVPVGISFNANDGATTKNIYGNSSTVQPPAYKVYCWKRMA